AQPEMDRGLGGERRAVLYIDEVDGRARRRGRWSALGLCASRSDESNSARGGEPNEGGDSASPERAQTRPSHRLLPWPAPQAPSMDAWQSFAVAASARF